MFYAKRFDLKEEKTVIEGIYTTEEAADEKCSELLKEEEKLPMTTCIFGVEEQEEDELPYSKMRREIMLQTIKEMEADGIHISPQQMVEALLMAETTNFFTQQS